MTKLQPGIPQVSWVIRARCADETDHHHGQDVDFPAQKQETAVKLAQSAERSPGWADVRVYRKTVLLEEVFAETLSTEQSVQPVSAGGESDD